MTRDGWHTKFLADGAPRWVRWQCQHGHYRLVDRLEVWQQQQAGTGWWPTCLEGHRLHVIGKLYSLDDQ